MMNPEGSLSVFALSIEVALLPDALPPGPSFYQHVWLGR